MHDDNLKQYCGLLVQFWLIYLHEHLLHTRPLNASNILNIFAAEGRNVFCVSVPLLQLAAVAIRSVYRPAQIPMYLGKQFCRGKCRGKVGTTPPLERKGKINNFIFFKINLCYFYNNEYVPKILFRQKK